MLYKGLLRKTLTGFTLVELIVSIGIISLISAVVFFNFPQFNESVALNRAARELTLTLREAQARAVAVTPLPNGIFPSNYGVYIKTAPTAEGDGQFLIFSDKDVGAIANNLKYDPCDPNNSSVPCDVLIKTVTFTRGVQITGLDAGMTEMYVFYRRPDPVILISDQNGVCIAGPSAPCGGSYGPFTITISRPSSATPQPPRVIEVWRTGQISIR